jgi:hypothetical protein
MTQRAVSYPRKVREFPKQKGSVESQLPTEPNLQASLNGRPNEIEKENKND